MTTSLRLFRPDGSLLGDLPDHEGLGAQQEHNDTGSFTCSYSRGGLNASAIDSDVAYVGLMVNGLEQDDRYLLEDDGEDPAGVGGAARMVKLGGRGVMAILEWAVTYPSDHAPGMTEAQLLNLEPIHAFADSTPGAIISTFIERAKARSMFDGADGAGDAIRALTYDFTSAVDSAGVAWPTRYSVTYDAGLDLLKVLLAALDNAWADARMKGMVLQLFVPETVLGLDRPDVIVRAGREVTSGPRKRTRRPIRSHMLGVGDEGAIVERRNLTARARYGRREGYEARAGITAVDTLARVTDASLTAVSDASEGFTLVCDLSADGPQPHVDYKVGQRIRYDRRRLTDTALEPMRVRSVALAWDRQGAMTASVEVNDLFVESQVRLKRKVDGIVNGSSSNSRAPQRDVFTDRLAPKAPASVSINTGSFDRADGTIGAAATVSWTAVTQNADGTAYDDFGSYFMSWAYIAVGSNTPERFVGEQAVRGEVAYIEGVRPGQRMVVRVRAVDFSGNSSASTSSPIVTVVSDLEPPPVPTAPAVVPGLGILRVTWDGLGVAGGEATQPMPPDLARIEVHVSTVGPDFSPSTATLHDTLLSAGVIAVVSGIAYGTTAWIRFVAVDRTGNRSAPSVAASGAISRVSGLDIQVDSLGRELVTFDARDIGGVVTYHQPEPPAGTTAVPLVVGDVWFETDAGNAMRRWSGTDWVSTVDAAIAAAQSTASGAQTSANSKNTVHYQATAPAGAHAVDDVWFDTDNGFAMSRWSGTAWVASLLGHQSIATLDLGKATVGELDGQLIKAGTLSAKNIIVGSFDNMIQNASFEQAAAINTATDWINDPALKHFYRSTPAADVGWSIGEHLTENAKSGKRYLVCTITTTATSNSRLLWAGAVDGGISRGLQPGVMEASAGSEYVFEAYTGVRGNSYTGSGVRAYMQFRDASGASVGSYAGPYVRAASAVSGAPNLISVTALAPPGTAYVVAGAQVATDNVATTSTTSFIFDDFYLRRMITGSLVVDGSITARNMAASSITAQNAALADLAVVRAKIADLAVDDAKIASLNVGKLVAGALNADITISARIKTANSGARVELNSLGLQAFDSAGTQTVRIGSDGSASLTGHVNARTGTLGTLTVTGTITGGTYEMTTGGRTLRLSAAPIFASDDGFPEITWSGNNQPFFSISAGVGRLSLGPGGTFSADRVEIDTTGQLATPHLVSNETLSQGRIKWRCNTSSARHTDAGVLVTSTGSYAHPTDPNSNVARFLSFERPGVSGCGFGVQSNHFLSVLNAPGSGFYNFAANQIFAEAGFTQPSASDRKADVTPMQAGLGKKVLKAVKPINFRYKAMPDVQQRGFRAEDLAPFGLTGDFGGSPTLDAMHLVAVLWEAVVGLQGEVDALKPPPPPPSPTPA